MKKIYFLFIALFAFSGLVTRAQVVNPGICMVTVDDSSKHNVIYYDKTQFAVADSFILHRENAFGTYTRIMANYKTALSFFLDMDTTADPNIQLHRYKLQIWSPGGGYSQLGPYHTVLYCLQYISNYNWNQYDIEGSGTGSVNNYVVLQDDNSTNQWHPIDTVSGTANSWVDPNVSSFPNGQWRLATMWALSCNVTAREQPDGVETAVVKSKSNITNNKMASVNQLKATGVRLFPNPATDQVTLRLNFPSNENTSIKIYNSLGVEVMNTTLPAGKDELQIAVSSLTKGFYFAEISNTKTKLVKRLVIE